MRPHYTPQLKQRTALLRELKQVFRRHRSQLIERVISLINPMLRGWVNYFAVGNSSPNFAGFRAQAIDIACRGWRRSVYAVGATPGRSRARCWVRVGIALIAPG